MFFLFMVSLQASQDDAIKQKESLANELKCIRVELQQVREDRERQVTQVQALIAEVEKYKEVSGESVAELDNLTTKSNALEVCCNLYNVSFILVPVIFNNVALFGSAGNLFIAEGADTYS